MTSRSTRHLTPVPIAVLLIALAAHSSGCGSRLDHAGTVGDRTSRASSAELDQELASYCANPENLVPTSVTNDEISCRPWLGEQEKLLCAAYGHFNTATRLEMQAAVTWPMRLAQFRAAVEGLLDLLFETGDLERVTGWQRARTEDKLGEPDRCPVNGDNPDNVDELLVSFRQACLAGILARGRLMARQEAPCRRTHEPTRTQKASTTRDPSSSPPRQTLAQHAGQTLPDARSVVARGHATGRCPRRERREPACQRRLRVASKAG
jgi:hypothetical protein